MSSGELYYWYKQNGICVNCGQENARPNRTLCWRCAANKSDRDKIRLANQSEEKREKRLADKRKHYKRVYEERKADGLCSCGRKRENDRFELCDKCRAKQRITQSRYNLEKGIMPSVFRGDGHFCAICLKPVEREGSKLCDRCHQNNVIKAEKARATRDNKNHVWKKISNAEYNAYVARRVSEGGTH